MPANEAHPAKGACSKPVGVELEDESLGNPASGKGGDQMDPSPGGLEEPEPQDILEEVGFGLGLDQWPVGRGFRQMGQMPG